jgi:hypothetical protein
MHEIGYELLREGRKLVSKVSSFHGMRGWSAVKYTYICMREIEKAALDRSWIE